MGSVDCCPWGAAAGRQLARSAQARRLRRRFLYTPDERRRRDETVWTIVQGVLAPVQFIVFVTSLALVLRFLATGGGETVATASIVVKTAVLYTIMVTGAIWERRVFGRYLFAPAFFWEDAVSMLVIALHTAYLAALFAGALDVRSQMLLALTAYATYLLNATQFMMKLRAARIEAARWSSDALGAQLERWGDELEEIAPIETALPAGDGAAAGQVVPVHLHAAVTEVGTLALSLVPTSGARKAPWKLELDIRLRSDG